MATGRGTTLAQRRYDGGGAFELAALDLQLAGHSLLFTGRGVTDLSGVAGLGRATFTAGQTTYGIAFNATGASLITQP